MINVMDTYTGLIAQQPFIKGTFEKIWEDSSGDTHWPDGSKSYEDSNGNTHYRW